MNTKPQKAEASIRIAASLITVTLITLIAYALQTVLVPLLFSIIFAVILFPMSRRLEIWGVRRSIAAVISIFVAIIVVLGLIYFIVSESIIIGRDASAIVDKFKIILDRVHNWIHEEFGISKGEFYQKAQAQLESSASQFSTYVTTVFNSVSTTLASFILVPVFTFFFVYYREFFKEFFIRAFKNSPREMVEQTLGRIYDVLQGYLLGLVIVMAIVAVLNSIGLMVMGIQYAWFFGTLASLLMLLPYIGIAIGSILPALFALATKDSYWYAIGIIVWFQVVQTLESNLITPNVVGGKVSINPLASIVALLMCGMLFGLSGFILALPLVAILKVFFDTVPSLNAFGFLLSEPDDYLITSKFHKRKIRLKKLKLLRKKVENGDIEGQA